MANAIFSAGTTIEIGQGDAKSTLPGVDVFDTVGEVTRFSHSGSDVSTLDVTTLGSVAKEFMAGMPNEGRFSIDINLHPSDVGQLSARQARSDRELRNFQVTLSDNSVIDFAGLVTSLSMAGGVDDVVKSTLEVQISGAVTWS